MEGRWQRARLEDDTVNSQCSLYPYWMVLISLSDGEALPHFHPEFGRFMLEATPGRPWGIDFKDLLKVESNMRWRYDSLSTGSCRAI